MSTTILKKTALFLHTPTVQLQYRLLGKLCILSRIMPVYVRKTCIDKVLHILYLTFGDTYTIYMVDKAIY
jgi:hypothetical protein